MGRLTPFRQRAVEPVELARDVSEALAFRVGTRTFRLAFAELRVLGESRNFGARQLGLFAGSRRGSDRARRCRCFEPNALEARERRHEDARLREQRCSRCALARCSHVHTVAQETRDRRTARERLRSQEDELPVSQFLQRTEHAAQERALVRPPLEHDQVALGPAPEELRVDALADDAVLTREADRGRLGRLFVRDDERVDASQQAISLCPTGRIAEPLRVQEGRNGHGLRVTQCQIRERRKPRLEAVDDVEPPESECEREVRAGTPPGRRSGCGARSGRPGPGRQLPRRARRAARGVPRPNREPDSTTRARSRCGRASVARVRSLPRAR